LRWGLLALLLIALAGTARALLPNAVRQYVNRTLDQSPLYAGEIGPLKLHLWRGAYSIQDVRISKRIGEVPEPLFSAKRIDFSLQWDALLRGRFVGRVLMLEPELNFVDAPSDESSQTGGEGPWLGMLEDLFPFQINRAVIRDGSIHLRVYWTDPPFDTYLSDVQATVDNLGNIDDDTKPLPATVVADGQVMDQAPFEFRMMLDPSSYRPTFRLTTRILGLDVTRINDLARAYGRPISKKAGSISSSRSMPKKANSPATPNRCSVTCKPSTFPMTSTPTPSRSCGKPSPAPPSSCSKTPRATSSAP
jgi:hypothetical protein